MLFHRRLVFVCLFLTGTIVAGCAGNITGGPPPSAVASSSASPGSGNTSLIAIPGTAGTVALPAVGGTTAGFTFNGGAPAGLTMSAAASASAPANAPVPASVARTSAASKKPASTTNPSFFYVTATFSAAVPAGLIASELLAAQVGGAITGINGSFYCDLDDLTSPGSLHVTFGPGTESSNGVLTIPNGTNAPALVAGHAYLFQFYVVGPTPTPSATATATATATASPTAAPTATATATSSAAPTATPSPQGSATPVPAYTFSGPSASTATVTPPTLPAALVVPGNYGTYGAHVTVTFGSETTTAPFSLGLALGSTANDISPSGTFPYYTGSAATPLFYALITTTAAVSFAQTPAVTVTANSFGSSNFCSLYVYANNGGTGFQWQTFPGAGANVAGSTVTIPAVTPPAGITVDLTPGKTQLVFVGC